MNKRTDNCSTCDSKSDLRRTFDFCNDKQNESSPKAQLHILSDGERVADIHDSSEDKSVGCLQNLGFSEETIPPPRKKEILALIARMIVKM